MLFLLIAAQAVVPPSLAASTVAPENKIVCQFEDDVTSRIRFKKVCLKQSQWDAIAEETQRDLDSSRNDRTIAPN